MSGKNEHKIKINEESQCKLTPNENLKQMNDLKKESPILSAKDLIIKLLKESLSNSLSTLEFNHKNQDANLKTISKDSKDNISKLLQLTKEVKENTIKTELKKEK